MDLNPKLNTMLVMSIRVNLDVLKKQKNRLNRKGQMNLEMLEEDFDKLIKRLSE